MTTNQPVTASELQQVFTDNMQAAGLETGWDPDVAETVGYQLPEQLGHLAADVVVPALQAPRPKSLTPEQERARNWGNARRNEERLRAQRFERYRASTGPVPMSDRLRGQRHINEARSKLR